MSADYTGDPTATQAPASQPGPGVEPIVRLPEDADPRNSASIYQAFKVLADFVAYLMGSGLGGSRIYGTGEDGAVTLDGSTDYNNFSTRSGSTYTLTRCPHATTFHVNSGVTLKFNSCIVFCTVKYSGPVGAVSAANGTNAAGTTPGTGAGHNVYLGGGSDGGTSGAAETVGGSSTAKTAAIGSAGGAGGNGGGGSGGLGGAAGTVTAPIQKWKSFLIAICGQLMEMVSGTVTPRVISGASGGGGGGGGTIGGGTGGVGGAGGGAAGTPWVCAREIDYLGTWQATGGNGSAGANGSGGGSGGGGGGGGGGGAVVCAYGKKTNLTTAVTVTAGTGGAGGTGASSGANGGNGTAGVSAVIEIQL